MRVIKCDRCRDINSSNWNSTIQINNEPRIDLCEKCMNELRLWLSNNTDNTVEDDS